MTRYTERKFVLVHCIKCERNVAKVLIGMETMCPQCRSWLKAETSIRRTG